MGRRRERRRWRREKVGGRKEWKGGCWREESIRGRCIEILFVRIEFGR